MKYSKGHEVLAVLFAVLFLTFLSSCSVLRGLRTDGRYGPGMYSYEGRLLDTIARAPEAFRFAESDKYAAWLDTLHFYTQGSIKEPMTLVESIETTQGSQGVLIIQNDTIVFERYWGSLTADRLATVFSVSKSVTSLLCGIAVDEGYIKSIDDPVTDYIPELKKKDPHWQRLTVRHLLDMRSGLDFDDTYYMHLKGLKRVVAIARLNYSHNVMKQVRNMKFRCEPGTEHFYESMTSQILGIVIERATGRPFAEYLSDKVWKPLQMEQSAVVNIDSRKHRVAQSFGGISMTARDLAKIGIYILTAASGTASVLSVKIGSASQPHTTPQTTATISTGTTPATTGPISPNIPASTRWASKCRFSTSTRTSTSSWSA